jgi:hypothetical protein
MLNATRRESLSEPTPITPGEIYKLDIQLDCTAWRFAPGHRIRLSIANADWPNVWPTPQPATNQVYRGPAHPSRLILPVVPASGSAKPPQFQPSTRSVSRHSAATDPPTWRVSRDLLTNRASVELQSGSSWRVDDSTVVERESSSSFDVNPRRPSDASAQGRHIFRLVHPGSVTESRADVMVQATATHFHLAIELEVRVNDALHFAKHWVDSVPRQYL